MALHEPDWTLWRSFLGVLNEGSLSGAARALRLTQPTIGRHIDELEAALETTLFTRSQFGLEPTTAALALAPQAEAMAATAASLVRIASGEAEEIRGDVRITASEIVGAEVLPPMLGAFRDEFPRVAIELVLSNETEDLVRRQADIAVRMIRPTQTSLVAKKIGSVTIGLHAHRGYIKRHGVPRNLDEAGGHTIIGFDSDTASIRALRRRGMAFDRRMFGLRSDSDLAQLAAIRAGAGIGAIQLGIARRDKSLVRVLPEAFAMDLEVWVAMHEDLRPIRRMRAMFDHLAAGLAAYVATSGG